MLENKDLYLECASGISGDMFVAAMIDLGADREALERAMKSIQADGFRTSIRSVKKNAITCCDFQVLLDEEFENHDHDMNYLHGDAHEHDHDHEHEHCHEHDHNHEHEHEHCHEHDHNHEHEHEHCHEHDHDHEHEHCHDHDHEHDHNHEYDHCHEHEHEHCHEHDHNHEHEHAHNHHHVHRGLRDVMEIVNACHINENARNLAEKIFTILAEAEAKAHGTDIDHVHFHEVGALDSIADIVAAAVCFDSLHVKNVYIPSIFEGTGTIRCAHGLLPIPVPAVSNIAAAKGLHLQISLQDQGEFVTPTGAAIAAAIGTSDRMPEKMKVCKVGYGAGKREYKRPSFLRAFLIEAEEKENGLLQDQICKIETNIDDSTGEQLGFVMDLLMQAGAKDVNYTPLYMKKGRPAWQLNVICAPEDTEKLERIIFLNTTTIGLRKMLMQRSILPREEKVVETPYGQVAVKIVEIGGAKKAYPEFESIAAISREKGIAYQEVYRLVLNAIEHSER